jgi:hypothetical protein
MKTMFSKITLAAALALAITFTLNACSGDDGNNAEKYSYCVYMEQQTCLSGPFETCANGGTPSNSCPTGYDVGSQSSSSSGGNNNPGTSDSYILVSYNSNSFTYIPEEREHYRCIDGGTLEKETNYRENTTMSYSMNYSNGNHILVLGSYGDTLHFKGTSANLIGTWTRTKDKNASCELNTWTSCIDFDRDKCECKQYKENSYIKCKNDYDITKLVFTQNAVAITRDRCRADEMIDGEVRNGWRYKIIGCDTYEMSKGTEKVTVTHRKTNLEETWEGTYNGKTCKLSDPPISQKAKACSDAWKDGHTGGKLEDAYYDLLEKDMDKCLIDNNFPKESYSGDEDEPYNPCYNKGY